MSCGCCPACTCIIRTALTPGSWRRISAPFAGPCASKLLPSSNECHFLDRVSFSFELMSQEPCRSNCSCSTHCFSSAARRLAGNAEALPSLPQTSSAKHAPSRALARIGKHVALPVQCAPGRFRIFCSCDGANATTASCDFPAPCTCTCRSPFLGSFLCLCAVDCFAPFPCPPFRCCISRCKRKSSSSNADIPPFKLLFAIRILFFRRCRRFHFSSR